MPARKWELDRLPEYGTRNENGCLLWMGSTCGGGYGQGWDGARKIRVHRYVFELANGPIAPGMMVLHRCDTPRCYEISHLFLGDAASNMKDKVEKGRQYRPPIGSAHHNAKLTDDDVRKIRTSVGRGDSMTNTAVRFGVSIALVSMIVSGKIWKHVS